MTESLIIICSCIVLALIINNRKKISELIGNNSVAPTEPINPAAISTKVSISNVSQTETIYKANLQVWRDETIKFLDNYQSLSDLLIVKKLTDINYGDLLSCFEWKFKRLSILLRDGYECYECKKRDERNHVHHTYYLKDELPWEINDSALITLCFDCHKKKHEATEIQVFKRVYNDLIPLSKEKPYCNRCGGMGYIPKYIHVQNGICFKCRGNLINQSVFYKIISQIYHNLNNYHDKSKREKYILYINQLTVNEFINKVPDYQNYVLQNTPSISSYDDIGDDLPF